METGKLGDAGAPPRGSLEIAFGRALQRGGRLRLHSRWELRREQVALSSLGFVLRFAGAPLRTFIHTPRRAILREVVARLPANFRKKNLQRLRTLHCDQLVIAVSNFSTWMWRGRSFDADSGWLGRRPDGQTARIQVAELTEKHS